MNHIPSYKNNYIFIYFEMPLKIGIYVHFSSSLSSKLTLVTSHSCIYNYKPLFNCFYDYKSFLPWCRGGQSHQQSKKWLIWTQVANVWVDMEKIPCSVSKEKEKVITCVRFTNSFYKKEDRDPPWTTYKCLEIHWVLSIVMTSSTLLTMKATITCVFCNLQQDNVHDLCHPLTKVINQCFWTDFSLLAIATRVSCFYSSS